VGREQAGWSEIVAFGWFCVASDRWLGETLDRI